MSFRTYFNTYTFSGLLRLLLSTIRTRIFYPKAKIIRFPFDIRGKKFIKIGEGFTTGVGCRIEAYPSSNQKELIVFGKNVQLNDYVHITAMNRVQIGNNVLMASKIYISDCSHGNYSGVGVQSNPESIPIERDYKVKSVIISDNVWIGESVSILPGVSIGKGAIIGANSVVTKNIPAYSIAVGNPAKIIKLFNTKLNIWENIN